MIPPCYVITLNDTLGKHGEALKEVGLDPILFKGVNAKDYSHMYYENAFHKFFGRFMAKGAKGCFLSHKLLCEKLYTDDADIALILEDDAYPIKDFEINTEIERVLTEVPQDWDIIRLHCDSWCENDSNTVKGSDASTAAYLISRKGIAKFKNSEMSLPVDIQQNVEMNVYKSKRNLFWADENKSTIRGSEDRYIFEPFLNFLFPIRNGEKTWYTKLNHKCFNIPLFNTEICLIDIISFIFVLVGLIIFYYINK